MAHDPAPDERGAPDALVRRLHDDHAAALLGWARNRLADQRDAEEVVAETLVKAWRRYDQFDADRGSERSWIFGIARNAANDVYRRDGRRLQAVPDELLEDAVVDTDLDQVVEATIVRDALAALPEGHRVVIVEAFYTGRTTTEIGARLGIPAGTVKSRLYYGMRALRAQLEERGVLG